ncbi:MAG: type I 3-dehydroquinate dehydratase [Armatimonadetes bacterium]|nr:type I 3-dehydroquinate dehydratase [Armatimonadota bacterium]
MRLEARRPVRIGHRVLGGPTVLTCVPLTAAERAALAPQAARLGALGPDCVEWRADFVSGLTPEDVTELLAGISAAASCPLIFTNRRHEEGGARPQDEAQRLAILEAAASTGLAALVDIEMATSPALAEKAATVARSSGTSVIRSWHDFGATPPAAAILDSLRAMQEAGADVAKVAVMPRAPQDVLVLLEAGLEARSTFLEIPCILMSMGAVGAMSRIGGGYFGSDLTFAVGIAASAPGQIGLDIAKRLLAAVGLGQEGEPMTGGS